jgi:hypothetical protein
VLLIISEAKYLLPTKHYIWTGILLIEGFERNRSKKCHEDHLGLMTKGLGLLVPPKRDAKECLDLENIKI